MSCLSSLMLSNMYPLDILTTATSINCHRYPSINVPKSTISWCNSSHSMSSRQWIVCCSFEEEGEKVDNNEESKFKWQNIGPDITKSQKQAISQLPLRMTNRCKALMKQIICLSQDDDLPLLLAAWVKAMKPTRADWLSVLKELKMSENPVFFKVAEYALIEDSFEANVRDYTKLIHSYSKHNLLENAEKSFLSMKNRGFPCDQVTLTTLVHMYSKAGDFDRAKEAFQEIISLGLPLDERAYGAMMMAYIRAGMLESAESLMRELEAQEVYAGKEVYKALLRAYAGMGNADGAQRVFNGIQLAGILPDDRLCTLLVTAYCVAGQTDRARSVVENMRNAGIRASDMCIALMLGAYEKENNLEKALILLMDMEKDGIKLAEEASKVLIGWFERLGVDHEIKHYFGKHSTKQAAVRSR